MSGMKPIQMLKIRRREKDPEVRDRIMLIVLVEKDGMSIIGAARRLGMAPSWGVKWRHRYLEERYRAADLAACWPTLEDLQGGHERN